MKYIIRVNEGAIFPPIFRHTLTDKNNKIIIFNNKDKANKYMKDNYLFNSFMGYYAKIYQFCVEKEQ